MFTLDFISARGSKMPLVNNEYFHLSGADGLTTTTIGLTASTTPAMDGNIVTNTQAQPRSIVLYLTVKTSQNVEEAKRYILGYIKPKLAGRLVWEQGGRIVEIEGVVEAITMPRFTNKAVMQVTMSCSQPFWEDAEFIVHEIAEVQDLHWFPIDEDGLAFIEDGLAFGEIDRNRTREYTNYGDVDVGMTIEIIATGTVVNPVIYNINTNEYIGITDTLTSNDRVVITTYKGGKTLTKNGINVLDRIRTGSTWLQLPVGSAEFRIDADSGDAEMYFVLTYKQRYV